LTHGRSRSGNAASTAFVMVMRNDADQRIVGGARLSRIIDRHTVKSWFNGRLDVAPPVIDLTAQGFALIGGRLDAISSKMVAVIVYRRRAHIINLFAAPGPAKRRPAVTEKVNGFNIRHWSDNGVSLWAISDINAEELKEFSDKLEAARQKQK
jgi:anti-sigma factor RsiW